MEQTTRLCWIIEQYIGHTRKFTATKRTIELYRFVGTRMESISLVIELKNPRVIALRHEVRRMVKAGWRVY